MTSNNTHSRRRFLTLAGVSAGIGLAGCAGDGDDDGDGGNGGGNGGSDGGDGSDGGNGDDDGDGDDGGDGMDGSETPGDAELRSELGVEYPDYELEDEVNVLHWNAYWHEDAVEDFENAFDVSVSVDTDASLNDFISNMSESEFNEYDVVFPSDFTISGLADDGWIQPLDLDKIPNWENLADRWVDEAPYDPGEERYSAPYQWGTTGIGWNDQLVDGSLDDVDTLNSWDALWDEQFAGQIQMLGAMREVYTAALKRMGESLNATDESVIQEATDMLIEQKEQMNLTEDDYDSAELISTLVNAEATPIHSWSGEATDAGFQAPEGTEVRYVIPEEGGVIWVDTGVVTANASNPNAAHAMINYTLAGPVAANITNFTYYPSPNEAAEETIFDEVLNDPTIYPPQEVQENLEFIRDVGDAISAYESGWEELTNA